MNTNNKDLWPKFNLESSSKTPKSILNQQAELFSSKTNNILNAYLIPFTSNDPKVIGFNFDIVAPALGNYKYRLLRMDYFIDKFFPVDLYHYEGTNIINSYKPSNVEELEEALSKIFNHSKTKQIVESLFAQSVEEKKDIDN